jgi:uncharacterized membrane protein YkoI
MLLGGALPVTADDHARARQLREAGEIVPLQQILGGLASDERVLEVELEDEHGGYRYEVEVLDAQGTVWEYLFDARSGELLKKHRED